jgi:ubiquinone/menaquinone biosynthesis C-methylase UbiE
MNGASRFAKRSAFYAPSRPGYPDAVIELLGRECGWTPGAIIADVGAGTGISSELFLRHGSTVFAIEPDAEMRACAEYLLPRHKGFQVVGGSAESTGLPDSSIDFVAAATAFHWFDIDVARVEFRRILRPQGWVVLLWNERRSESSNFSRAYEDLLQSFGTDYKQRWGTQRKNLLQTVGRFFAGPHGEKRFENLHSLDFDGLRARLLSASYAPLPGEPGHDGMIAELRQIFERFQGDGQIAFEYETVVCWGRL